MYCPSNFKFLIFNCRSFFSQSGQATTELVILLPLLLFLAGAAMVITYGCWQGLRVQQAANLAARIQGQERISGGPSQRKIDEVNGVSGNGLGMAGDADPTTYLQHQTNDTINENAFNQLPKRPPQSNRSVFGKYYYKVKNMFSMRERDTVFVPAPKIGYNSDRVKVIRTISPPEMFGHRMRPIILEGIAYGGEDSHMYSLPRWGPIEDNSPIDDPYWAKQIQGQ